VAHFEGVCSGDIYVLEPANDRLMPELLPFLCQTDAFFDHAVGTSAGSLSPRTNWTSLASFEFLLPPIQEQARLVEVMEASRSAMEASRNLLIQLRALRASLVLVVTGSNEFQTSASGSAQIVKLGDVSNVVRGSTPRPAGDKRYFGGDHIPWITVGEITKDDDVFLNSTETCLTKLGKTFSRVVPAGTVVLSNSGWTLGVPKILSITGCANDGVAAFLDLDPKIDAMFLYFRLFGMTEYLRNVVAAGGDQPNLNTERISQLTIPLLTLSEQQNAIAKVGSVQAEIEKVKLRQAAQADLHRRLTALAFSSRD
jgi:type I restriction enzyme S subunit